MNENLNGKVKVWIDSFSLAWIYLDISRVRDSQTLTPGFCNRDQPQRWKEIVTLRFDRAWIYYVHIKKLGDGQQKLVG